MTNENKITNQTKKFFIYARKSTDSEDRQVRSINDQIAELKELAKKENVEVVDTLVEKQTAKKPGRPVFAEMLKRIEVGEATGILAWHPDRLARNSVDGGQIIYLVDTGVVKELKFPTFWFDPTPQGKFMLSIAFGQSKYYIDNLSENIKRGHRQKLKQGLWPQMAPLGYLNNKETKQIYVDKTKAKFIKKAFEAYASGKYTLKEVRKIINGLGLRGRRDKMLSTSNYQYLLQNPFYYGLIRYNGEYFEGKHEPIIAKKLFDRVQEIMKQKSRPKTKKLKYFLYRGFFRCGECGFTITADRKIKKSGREYVYYFCTRKSKIQKCEQNRFLREESFAEQVKENCQKVSLPDVWRKRYLNKLKLWENENRQTSDLFAQNLKKEISAIKTKSERLTDAYLSEALELTEYQQTKNALMAEKKTKEEKLSDFERKGNHWLELTRNWILEANQAKNLASQDNFSEMKNYLKKIGSNRLLAAGRLEIDFKKPFDSLAKLPTEARGEAPSEATNSIWWTHRESNPGLSNANAA